MSDIKIPDAFLDPASGSHRPEHQKCPHCSAALSLKQVVDIIQGGHGFRRFSRVLLPTGEVRRMAVGDINPQTVQVLD